MRVTIGIPFYNNRHTLPDTLRSVFAQTYQDWELLLVDDGSTDGSLDLAKSVNDPRVRVLSDGVNRKAAYRHNEINEHAAGEYIARLDADDLMYPDRLERQVAFLDEQPQVDVVGTQLVTFTSDFAIGDKRKAGPFTPTARRAVSSCLLSQGTVMGRTDWFRRNPYRLDYLRAEDREMFCRAFAHGERGFAQIPEPLTLYRQDWNDGSVSLWKVLASHRTDRRIIREYGPRLIGRASTAREWLTCLAKSLAWRAYAAIGIQNRLISMRGAKLTVAEEHHAAMSLGRVLGTSVPGLVLPDVETDVIPMTRPAAA